MVQFNAHGHNADGEVKSFEVVNGQKVQMRVPLSQNARLMIMDILFTTSTGTSNIVLLSIHPENIAHIVTITDSIMQRHAKLCGKPNPADTKATTRITKSTSRNILDVDVEHA